MLYAWSVLLIRSIGWPSARSDLRAGPGRGHPVLSRVIFLVPSKSQGHVHGCDQRSRLQFFCDFDPAQPIGERNRSENRLTRTNSKAHHRTSSVGGWVLSPTKTTLYQSRTNRPLPASQRRQSLVTPSLMLQEEKIRFNDGFLALEGAFCDRRRFY